MASPPPEPHRLLNTTYTLHRLSPLHSFPSSPSHLKSHNKPLLNLLRGDILRGVRITDATEPDKAQLSRAGRLVKVVWSEIPPWLGIKGVQIELQHESSVYTALLLGEASNDEENGGREFVEYPLLATRMPKSHLTTLLHYLSTTFDCLHLPLHLSPEILKECLSTYLTATSGSAGGRDLVLTFSPPPPPSSPPIAPDLQAAVVDTTGESTAPIGGLKTITLSLDRIDVPRFYIRQGGFWQALEKWGREVMGVDIGKLGLEKIAVGGFVAAAGAGSGAAEGMTRAGKCKIFDNGQEEAGEKVLRVLVARAGERC